MDESDVDGEISGGETRKFPSKSGAYLKILAHDFHG